MDITEALSEVAEGAVDRTVDAAIWLASDMLPGADPLVAAGFLAAMVGCHVLSARLERRPGWRWRVADGAAFAAALVLAMLGGFRIFQALVLAELVDPVADGEIDLSFFWIYGAALGLLYVAPPTVRAARVGRRAGWSGDARAEAREAAERAAFVALAAFVFWLS